MPSLSRQPNRISRLTLAMLVIVVGIFAFGNFASAAFTSYINYQGKLTDSYGNAVSDGAYNMRFRLCTASASSACSGSVVFNESHLDANKVTVTDGLFSVMLGSVSSSLSTLDFNRDLYLEVSIGGTSTPSFETLSPVKQLGAVPNAFNAKNFDGLATTSFLRADLTNAVATITNLTSTNFYTQKATISAATTTNFFSSILTVLTGWFTDLFSTNATITNLNATNATTTGYLTVGTAPTGANFSAGNLNIQNNVFAGGYVSSTSLQVNGNASTTGSLNVGSSFGLNSEYFTDLTGLGLTNYGGTLRVATTSLGLLTTDVAEGTNLYWTSARATSSFSLLLPGYASFVSSTYSTQAYNSSTFLSLTNWFATTTWAGGNALQVNNNVTTTGYLTVGTAPTGSNFSAGNLNIQNNVFAGGYVSSTALQVNGISTTTNLTITGLTNTVLYANSLGQVIATSSGNGFSQWTTNGSNIYYNTGSVGIGTTTPQAQLHIASNTYSMDANNVTTGSILGASSQLGTYGIYIRNRGDSAGISGLTYVNQIFNASVGNGIELYTMGAANLTLGTVATARLTVVGSGSTAGNVGIGTTTPDSLLQVGNATQYFKVSSAGNATTTGYLTVGTAPASSNWTAGSLNVQDKLVVPYVSSTNLTVSGNSVLGTTTITNLSVTNLSTSTFAGGLTVGTTQLVVQQDTGNVGIGTAAPSTLLNLSYNENNSAISVAYATNSLSIINTNTGGVDGAYSILRFGWPYSGDQNYIQSIYHSNNSNDLVFGGGGGTQEVMRIMMVGNSAIYNVGIGSSTPWAKLSITNSQSVPSFIVEDQASPDPTPFIINASGNVGIQKVVPITALDVNGTVSSTGLQVNGDSVITGTLNVSGATTMTSDLTLNASADSISISGGGRASTAINSFILFNPDSATQGAFAMYYNGSGAGTTRLGVTEAGSAMLFTNNNSSTTLLAIGTSGNIPLIFGTNNAERMRILNSGEVGIGTTTPTVKLDVYDTTASINSSGLRVTSPSYAMVTLQTTNDGNYKAQMVEAYSYAHSFWIKAGSASAEILGMYSGNTYLGGGNVGIGTTTPDSLLQVGNATQYFKVSSAGNATTTGYLTVGTAPASSNWTAGSLNIGDGLVANGTVSSTGLQVNGNGTVTGSLTLSQSTGGNSLVVDTSGLVYDSTNNRVGVGTASPTHTFTVNNAVTASYSNIAAQFADTADPAAGIFGVNVAHPNATTSIRVYGSGAPGILNNAGGLFQLAGSALILAADTGKPIYMYANGAYTAPQFTISAAGNVGIGTTTPNTLLQVGNKTSYFKVDSSGNASTTGYLTVGSGTAATDSFIDFQVANATRFTMGYDFSAGNFVIATGTALGSSNVLTISSTTGNVRIGNSGTASSTSKFSVYITPNTVWGGVNNSTGAWMNGSDARLKTDVSDLENPLEKVLGLRPVRYNWISDGFVTTTGQHIGFIAQEVENVLPELVGNMSGYKSLSYAEFAPILTGAIQQQQQEIDLLKSQLSSTTPVSSSGGGQITITVSETDPRFNTLRVSRAADFYGTITVVGEAGFESKVTFKNDVEIQGKLYLDKDQAGTITVVAGSTTASVTFDKPYNSIPKVIANLNASTSTVFARFVAADKTVSGFKIVLEQPASEDLSFDWLALGVRGQVAGVEETVITGCTDPQATNYNPAATASDNSCQYSAAENPPADEPSAEASSTQSITPPITTTPIEIAEPPVIETPLIDTATVESTIPAFESTSTTKAP